MKVTSSRMEWEVSTTADKHRPSIEPVILFGHLSTFHVQDYLTVEEARELAAALLAAAGDIEARDALAARAVEIEAPIAPEEIGVAL